MKHYTFSNFNFTIYYKILTVNACMMFANKFSCGQKYRRWTLNQRMGVSPAVDIDSFDSSHTQYQVHLFDVQSWAVMYRWVCNYSLLHFIISHDGYSFTMGFYIYSNRI